MSDSLTSLVVAVQQADSPASLTDAVQALADLACPETVSHLIEALNYNNPGAAVAAVDGLVRIGEPAVPSLLEQLDLNNYTARSWAVRALAGIGDPRGTLTLLDAATTDFSMSVRRAAAKGLGCLKWQQFPDHLVEPVQHAVRNTLLSIAQQDEEWVVRYAAIVGLEALTLAAGSIPPALQAQTAAQLATLDCQESVLSVRARIWQAQSRLQGTPMLVLMPPEDDRLDKRETDHVLSTVDWDALMDTLHNRRLISA